MTVEAILGWLDRWAIALVMAAGFALRIVCYLTRKGFWMDEWSLANNVRVLRPGQFFGPLLNHQLATPGFLLVAWSLENRFGDHAQIFRLIPLVASLVGLFLFLAVARRCLPDRAVLSALVMFAGANHLIYYASEFKQYATDLTGALACLLVGLTVGSRPMTVALAAALSGFGALIVWFSHPTIFVLASVGLVGIGRAFGAKDRRAAGLWMAIGAVWLVSFAGVHQVSTRQLGQSGQMDQFWGFAFPPWPVESLWDATWVARRLAYVFINPLNFDGPFSPRWSPLPAIVLAMVGLARLARRDRGRLALLVIPVLATLAAAALRLYPFHGRLVLFLVPTPLIAIAAGLDAVREARGRRVIYYGLVALVLVYPTVMAVDQAFDERWSHNHYGDLHPADVEPDGYPF